MVEWWKWRSGRKRCPHFTILTYVHYFLLLRYLHKPAPSLASQSSPNLFFSGRHPVSICLPRHFQVSHSAVKSAQQMPREEHNNMGTRYQYFNFAEVFPICICQKGFGLCISSFSSMPHTHKNCYLTIIHLKLNFHAEMSVFSQYHPDEQLRCVLLLYEGTDQLCKHCSGQGRLWLEKGTWPRLCKNQLLAILVTTEDHKNSFKEGKFSTPNFV